MYGIQSQRNTEEVKKRKLSAAVVLQFYRSTVVIFGVPPFLTVED
jgi:hypothetical protein